MNFKVSFTVSALAFLEEPTTLRNDVDWILGIYNPFLTSLYGTADIRVDPYTSRSHDVDFYEYTLFGYQLSFHIQSNKLQGFYHIRAMLESIHSFVTYIHSDISVSPLVFDPDPSTLLIAPEEAFHE